MEIKLRLIDNGWIAAYHTTVESPVVSGEVYANLAEDALRDAMQALVNRAKSP